ncbi:MAG: endonuclease domain-containing protein [Firmicutes bacterium]|nr:endonuclease domain-containing protein [Bacillota bacterium]
MEHRHHPGTKSEERVARGLKRLKLPFQRSVTLGPYEIDFQVGRKILIEVDGYVHIAREARRHDQIKERYLADLGYRLFRITNTEAHNPTSLEFLLEGVKEAYYQERQGAEREPAGLLDTDAMRRLRDRLAEDARKRSEAEAQARQEDEPVDDARLFHEWIERESAGRGKKETDRLS